MSAKQWRAARDHAVDLASARWREVGELQDAETLFSSERVKTLTGSSSANLATIRDARHRLSSHAQELRGLVEQLNRLVGIWGFNPPAGATEAVGMLDNIVEGRSWSELPDLWLTTEGIATARSTATVLKQALEAERLAQQAAAPLFTAAALDVNLSEIERTLTENSGALSRFKADFKAARNELEAVSQPGSDWRSVAREIPRARYWRECLDFRSGREAELAAYLGGHYAGFDTDWQSIQDKLAVAEQCVATIDGFANRAEFVFGMRGAEPTNYDQANYLATGLRESEAPDSFATIVSKRSDDDRMLAHAERWLSEFEAVAGQVVDIDRAQAAIRSAWTARTAHDNLLSAAGETAADLGVAVDERDESVEMIESSLDWVERFRGVISSGPGHLTNAVLEALNNAEIGTGVETIVNDWESAKVAFQQSFSERRVQLFQEDFSSIDTSRALIDDLKSAAQEREVWNSFQRDRQAFLELGLERALTYTQRFDVAPSQFAAVVEFMMVKAWLDWALRSDERFSIGGAESRDELAQSFRKEDAQLSDISVGRIIEVLNDRRPKTTRGQASIIQRESEKKKRHVPVRQLMSEARDVISALKPCFMMSPLAVSQYLPPDMKFDVVIFDEASQVLPADAINCIYRGRALITAGDQKQLPPTSFFTSSSDDDDDLAEEENAALDFESILDLMKSSGNFTSLTLNWHYRSRHEQLISYSNTSFYSNRLITFPGAIADSPDLGVKFYAVDGVYKRGAGRDNPIEAQAVARRVIEHFKTRPGKSLGVITFSASQRDTVGNAVELERAKHPELNDFFEEDRVDGFFIKSIESVQGDERDVIIFSIGYGPDESGQTYQNFGALNKAGGERRLNVAITRARELVEVVSSMSSSLIKDGTNEGTRHLRRYLDFAERGEAALAMELGPSGLGTDSPFEDAVIDAIRGWGFEVQPQVGVAGFRIDIGVKHPNLPGAFMLGVECDGAMYHSSRTARDRDRLRHDILEGLGWHLHHIWGTDWYRNREREADRLHQVLETFAAMPTVGRGTARDVNPSMLVDSAPTYGALFSADIGFTKPPWTKEYQVSRPSVPYIFDWADPTSSSLLIPAINEIVRVESPLHREVLNTRIREITGVGRVGARIQSAIDRAISKSEARIDGDFLLSTKTTTVVVRTPWTDARPIEHIHTEELSNALIGVIEDSVGTDKVQAIAGVCSIFAWQRTGARIRDRLESILDSLIALGKVQESVTGALTIKASSL
jgi:very-short-patch-repair endonuclease